MGKEYTDDFTQEKPYVLVEMLKQTTYCIMFDPAVYGLRTIFTVYYAIKVLTTCMREKNKTKIPWFYLSKNSLALLTLGTQEIFSQENIKVSFSFNPLFI